MRLEEGTCIIALGPTIGKQEAEGNQQTGILKLGVA